MNKILTIQSVIMITIFSLFIGFGGVAFVLSIGTALFPGSDSRFLNILSVFIGQGIMVVPVVAFVYLNKLSICETIRIKPIPMNSIFSVIILSLGTIILSDEIDRMISLVFPLSEYIEKLSELVQFDTKINAFFLILATVIIAPFSEEVIFRGFLQQFLEGYWQDITKAVLVTSLCFAMIHLNPGWIIQIYLLGVILGYLAWKTGSIVPGLILHALNNGLALILQNFQSSLESIYTWKGHVSPLILTAAIFMFIKGYKSLNRIPFKTAIK